MARRDSRPVVNATIEEQTPIGGPLRFSLRPSKGPRSSPAGRLRQSRDFDSLESDIAGR